MLPPPKVCGLIYRLHGKLSSTNPNEAKSALDKLNELLSKHGCGWADLPQILL